MSLELHENPPFALQVSLIKSLASIMQPRMGCSYQRRESMRINLASSFNHSSQWQRQRMLRDAKVYHKFNPNFTTTQHPKQKFPQLWLGGCTSAHQPWRPLPSPGGHGRVPLLRRRGPRRCLGAALVALQSPRRGSRMMGNID